MKNRRLTTPVLFLIFKRADTTQRVFDVIRKAKPSKLFVAADGPREGKAGEAEQCRATRDIIRQVDWECEVKTNFREKNVGLKTAVSSAIDWFFQNVEEGIILEDDCLPSQSFFWFCQELLERYRGDERIMMISGSNSQFGRKRGDASYYFSRLPGIWGWATWRKAWRYFDLSLQSFPKFEEQNQIRNVFADRTTQNYWMNKMQVSYSGVIHSWSYAWLFAMLTQNGLCICPNENLVSNIGFGQGATQGVDPGYPFANLSTTELESITHAAFILPSQEADAFETRLTARYWFRIRTKNKLKSAAVALVRQVLREPYRKELKKLIYRVLRKVQ